MKKPSLITCIIIVLTLVTNVALSQNIKFNYDACGNRTSRITVTKSSEAAISDSVVPGSINKEQSLSNLHIDIYPNPTIDKIQINLTGIEKDINIDAYLFSGKGEMLTSFILNGREQSYDLQNYSSGIYYLKIRINEKVESWKIIKQ